MYIHIYIGYIGIMETKMEATIWGLGPPLVWHMDPNVEYWGYIGIMESTMEATI